MTSNPGMVTDEDLIELPIDPVVGDITENFIFIGYSLIEIDRSWTAYDIGRAIFESKTAKFVVGGPAKAIRDTCNLSTILRSLGSDLERKRLGNFFYPRWMILPTTAELIKNFGIALCDYPVLEDGFVSEAEHAWIDAAIEASPLHSVEIKYILTHTDHGYTAEELKDSYRVAWHSEARRVGIADARVDIDGMTWHHLTEQRLTDPICCTCLSQYGPDENNAYPLPDRDMHTGVCSQCGQMGDVGTFAVHTRIITNQHSKSRRRT